MLLSTLGVQHNYYNIISVLFLLQCETEDMTISQHSLAGDFDYSELVQS